MSKVSHFKTCPEFSQWLKNKPRGFEAQTTFEGEAVAIDNNFVNNQLIK